VGSSGFCRQLCDGEQEECWNQQEGDSAWCAADMRLCSAFGGATLHCVSKVKVASQTKKSGRNLHGRLSVFGIVCLGSKGFVCCSAMLCMSTHVVVGSKTQQSDQWT
jgi:hypothetical protein